MNGKQLGRVRKYAAHVAENDISVVASEDAKGNVTGYAITIDGRRYGRIESFYEAFPQFHTPYHVRQAGEKWTLIFMEDEDENRFRSVDGEPLFTKRQAAYRRRKELNDWWQSRQPEASYLSW